MKHFCLFSFIIVVFCLFGYWFYGFYRCRQITVCFVNAEIEVNGIKYAINQKLVDKFVLEYKKGQAVNTVSFWRKADVLGGFEQFVVPNKKTKVLVQFNNDGKMISVVPGPTSTGMYIRKIGVLGNGGETNEIYIIVNDERISEISTDDVRMAFGDVLYWTVTGDAPNWSISNYEDLIEVK